MRTDARRHKTRRHYAIDQHACQFPECQLRVIIKQFRPLLLPRPPPVRCLIDTVACFLTELCVPVTSASGWQHLRSASTDIQVPRLRIYTSEYISDLLTSLANIPGRSALRASSCGNIVVPRTRRRIGDRAFSVAARRAWNRLPTELKLL